MNLIRIAIERPIAVIAAVLMVVMFGIVALQAIPIQLAPDVRQPVITVETIWGGAAPAEIEREIVIEQEDVLKGLEGLQEITARAQTGRARVTLEFAVGTNMDRALLLTANRLDRVPGYPLEVDEPTLDTSGNDDNPIAWFLVTAKPGNERPIHTYGDFVEDVIAERLERVPGIAKVNVYGGSEREIKITVEPERMARYGLTVSDVVRTLREANSSGSAGDVDEGKRRYVVRTEAELDSLEAVNSVVLRTDEDEATGRLGRVTVGDIAKVSFGYKEPTAIIRVLGERAIAFNAVRDTGANVIETMKGVRAAIQELDSGVVAERDLRVRQVYDETVYINSAIDLVRQNIWIGGSLAAAVLLLFLRSFRATLIISLAIPVSVIGAFVAMAALGRSINVISLAGLAFAVGMVVDAAIVVLENIYRLREQGKSNAVAAYRGAQQVWGAVLVSALTTVMVFIPILIMELEVGQLFRDIAVAISVAVLLSLVVSITVIPALSNKLYSFRSDAERSKSATAIRLPVIDDLARAFSALVLGSLHLIVRSKALALLVVAAVTTAAAVAAVMFLPKLEYLPEGNRNLVFGVIVPPPGYNLETTTAIASEIETAIKPHWASVSGPEREPGGPPKIERFFFVATRGSTFLGAISHEPEHAAELIPVLQDEVFREPGTFGFINQPSIFGRGIGSGRKIELDVSGTDLETLVGVAQQAMGRAVRALPREAGNQFRPNPGLELGSPELRVVPDRLRLADNRLTATELSDSIDAFNDGLRVAEVTVGTAQLDLTLEGPTPANETTQGIANLPIVTGAGRILPTSSVADVVLTAGPTEIRHRERRRTITLEIRPAANLPLEQAVDILKAEVIAPLQQEGLPTGVTLDISGTADKLAETWDAMVLDLALAIAIVYLVMAVLFESFIYPLVILLAVPLAAAGGIGGLAALNTYVYQPLDMLTLLGFVILVGIVVNNAILLVHQTVFHVREEGMAPDAAILEATRNRIRPIFMSTLTSIFGMLPLVVFPGAGSELYRGLGSVVIGGLSMSALLTLFIIPPMLTFLVGPLEFKERKPRQTERPPQGAVPDPAPGE